MSQLVLREDWQLKKQLLKAGGLSAVFGERESRCICGILAAELTTTSTPCWGTWLGACVSNVQTVQQEERFLLCCYYIARKIEVVSLFPWLFFWSLISFRISGERDSCSQDVHKCVCACLLVHLFKSSISSISFEHTISFQQTPEASNIQLFCSQNDWFLFGLGWMVNRILYCFHWPCHTYQEKMVPPFPRAAEEMEQKLSALHFIESSDAAKISRTQIYPFGKWNDQFSTWVRLSFLQNLYSFY